MKSSAVRLTGQTIENGLHDMLDMPVNRKANHAGLVKCRDQRQKSDIKGQGLGVRLTVLGCQQLFTLLTADPSIQNAAPTSDSDP